MTESDTAKGPPGVELHIASAPEFDAFDVWHASLSSLFFDVRLLGENTHPRFRGDVTGFHLGDSLIFNSASIGHHHERSPALVRRTGIDHIMIEYQTAGRRRGDFEGRSVDIQPGDVSFIDFGRTLRSEEPDFARVSFIVPRDRLPATLRERDLHGVVLDRAQGTTRLLGRYLASLVETANQLAMQETGAAVDAALLLAESAWETWRELSPEQAQAARPALRHMAMAYIDRHLAKPGLTPEAIAAALRMSRATLYRLFEAEGGVRAHIVARRLDRCFDALMRARTGSVSVHEVAFAHGFASEAHFSRAFRSRFGVRPRDVLGMAREHLKRSWTAGSGLSALATMPDWVRTLGGDRTAAP